MSKPLNHIFDSFQATCHAGIHPHRCPGFTLGPASSAQVLLSVVFLTLLLAGYGCGRKSTPPEIRRLVSGPGPVRNPSISPDGSTIAFQVAETDHYNLWTAPISGGKSKRLTRFGGTNPVWSPEGSRLAFESTRSGNNDIWIISAGGGTPTRVTVDSGADWRPQWSPDGKWIAFQSNRDSMAIWGWNLSEDRVVRLSGVGGINPKWSPDSRRIVYQAKSAEGNWEIYAADMGRRRIVELTFGGGADVDPVWSPDGDRIAYRSISKTGADIFLVKEGEKPFRLTENCGADSPPVWSPQGDRIAFVSYRSWNSIVVVQTEVKTPVGVSPAPANSPEVILGGLMNLSSPLWHHGGDRILFCARSSDIWTAQADGGPPSRVTDDIFEDRKPDVSPDGSQIIFESNRLGNPGLWSIGKASDLPKPFLVRDTIDAHPRFSPDGKWIAFTSRKDRDSEIWAVSPDRSDFRRMTSGGGLKGRPTWYKDSQQIIFESKRSGIWALWALRPDQTALAPVIRKPSMRPAWSPDGLWLAYQSDRDGNQDIYLTQMRTGDEQQLTFSGGRESDPAWSRDSKQIAFVSDREGDDDIFVTSISGDSLRSVTSGPEDDIEPTWHPDGKRIIFVRLERPAIWSVSVP